MATDHLHLYIICDRCEYVPVIDSILQVCERILCVSDIKSIVFRVNVEPDS